MITFNLVPATARASAVFVEQEAVSRGKGSPVLKRKVLVPGQFNSGKSPTTGVPQLILNREDSWTRYGRGSMLARMLELIIKYCGGVEVYALPLADHASGVAAQGSLAFTGTATASGTVAIYIGGKKVFVAVSVDDTAADVATALASAINADLDLPVTAAAATGTVTLTTRWKGESGNQIRLESNLSDNDSTPAGLSVAVLDIGTVTSGENDPDFTDIFDALGDTWYTGIAFPYLSADAITALEAAGDQRVDPQVKRPFAGFLGYTDTLANFITFLGTRNSQWSTLVPVFGSSTPAFMIAAAAAAVFARYQQATPGRPMKNIRLPEVLASDDNDLIYNNRDLLVKAGGSHTYNQEDGTVTIGDLCTTRTTTEAGADTEDWMFTIIIANIQFKIYALEQTLRSSPFDRAVVLEDGDGPGPVYAVRPSTVKSYGIKLVDDWIAKGLSTKRKEIVEGITAAIDSNNAGRINLSIPDIPSAGLRILAAKLEWAFVV